MRRIATVVVVGLALFWGAGCARKKAPSQLDLDLIRVSGDARLRTDTVGGDAFTDIATFVLVDAENTAGQSAYVTLGGELTSQTGEVIGTLNPQSLWIPARESRTFALVDRDRKPRPDSTSARIVVRGASLGSEPRAHIDDLHTFDDDGKVVVQATLVNDADRIGRIMVIASFHGADGRPMTRPFSMVPIRAKSRHNVQFVGPPGSTTGTIYVGDVNY